MRVKLLVKSKKVFIIVFTLVFLLMSLFFPKVAFAGTGNIDDGNIKKLNLNLALFI